MKATHNLDTGKVIAGANHHRNRSLTVHFHYPLRDDRWMWHRKRVNRCFAVNTIVFSVISGHKDGICTYAGRAATKRFKRTVSHFPMCVCVNICVRVCLAISSMLDMHLFTATAYYLHSLSSTRFVRLQRRRWPKYFCQRRRARVRETRNHPRSGGRGRGHTEPSNTCVCRLVCMRIIH